MLKIPSFLPHVMKRDLLGDLVLFEMDPMDKEAVEELRKRN